MKRFWSVLFIFFIWFVFSLPYFFMGRVPFPSNYQHNAFDPWMGYGATLGAYKNGAMPDVITQIYPWKTFTIASLKQGIIPFWNPYSFSGTLHLANYQSAVLTPLNLLFFILPFVDAWSVLILLQPLLAGLFMYLFVRSLQISKVGSVISSVSFMFCGFVTVWMAYGTLGYAILFLPLALFAIEKYVETKKIWFLTLLTATIPLSFFSGHFQTSVYFMIGLVAYGLWRVEKKTASYLPLAMSIISGLLISMPQIVPSMEAYGLSLRSGLFSKGEVIPWAYLPTLFAPDVFGNPVTRNDWFGHYAEWNGYIGLIPLLLAIYPLSRKPTKRVLFFSLAGIISLLLALPTPLLDIIVALHIPVLSTSAAGRIIVLFSFFFAVLSGLGFDLYIQDIKARKWGTMWRIFLGTCLVFGFVWICIIGKLFIPLDKLVIARQNMLLPSILFAVFIFLAAVGYVPKRKLLYYHRIFVVVVICLVSLDMLRFAMKWMPFDPRAFIFSETPVDSFYKKIPVNDRVFGNFGAEQTVYYGLSGVEGYDAVYNQRYGDFIKYLDKGKPGHSEKSLVVIAKNGIYTKDALDLLNVRYIIHKQTDAHAPWTLPFWTYQDHMFTKVYDDGAFDIYKNNQALPRAWFTSDYIVERDDKKNLSQLFSNNTLREKVVLEKNPGFPSQKTTVSPVTITEYTPNKVTLRISAHSDGMVFLADSYYPGWKVFVDGKGQEILRADYTFRSVRVTKSTHEIVFSYVPQGFILGMILSVLGLLSTIISVVIFSRKKTL